jgi:hypothetical protein
MSLLDSFDFLPREGAIHSSRGFLLNSISPLVLYLDIVSALFHPESKSSEGIFLQRYVRISIQGMPTGLVPRGSGASTGDGSLCELLTGLHKCAVCDRGLVWEDPFPS